MNTPFDNIFDFNGDGQLDRLEKGSRDAFIINMINDCTADDDCPNGDDDR